MSRGLHPFTLLGLSFPIYEMERWDRPTRTHLIITPGVQPGLSLGQKAAPSCAWSPLPSHPRWLDAEGDPDTGARQRPLLVRGKQRGWGGAEELQCGGPGYVTAPFSRAAREAFSSCLGASRAEARG